MAAILELSKPSPPRATMKFEWAGKIITLTCEPWYGIDESFATELVRRWNAEEQR